MKQNHEIRFKVTKEEHDLIKEKAKQCGMTIKQFLLYLGKNSSIKVSIST